MLEAKGVNELAVKDRWLFNDIGQDVEDVYPIEAWPEAQAVLPAPPVGCCSLYGVAALVFGWPAISLRSFG